MQLLRRVPLAVAGKRRVQDALAARAYARTKQRLHAFGPRGRQLADALQQYEQGRHAPEQIHWVERIEAERAALLDREEALIDGTLGAGGIYDRNVTVRMACRVSKPPHAARFLYTLVRAVRPARVLELGTNVGISGAYIAAALVDTAGSGQLVSCDSSQYRQRLARQMHARLGLKQIEYVNGLFSDTLAPTLRAMRHVDLAFIDGHHLYQPTLDYTDQILSYCQPDAVLVFDDIRWSSGMKRAWRAIKRDQRFAVVVDLGSMGLAVVGSAGSARLVSARAKLPQ